MCFIDTFVKVNRTLKAEKKQYKVCDLGEPSTKYFKTRAVLSVCVLLWVDSYIHLMGDSLLYI